MSRDLPVAVGLCPAPEHTSEFYVPLDLEETNGVPLCPHGDCNLPLVVYRREETEEPVLDSMIPIKESTDDLSEQEREAMHRVIGCPVSQRDEDCWRAGAIYARREGRIVEDDGSLGNVVADRRSGKERRSEANTPRSEELPQRRSWQDRRKQPSVSKERPEPLAFSRGVRAGAGLCVGLNQARRVPQQQEITEEMIERSTLALSRLALEAGHPSRREQAIVVLRAALEHQEERYRDEGRRRQGQV